MTTYHLLANMLDPRYRGAQLTEAEKDTAMEECEAYYPEALPYILKYNAKATPFLPYMFEQSLINNVTPLTWWRSIGDRLNKPMLALAVQLHTAVASSSGIERVFSTFGFVHSKIRNRLGTEKAAKLVSIFKSLNRSNN